MVLDVLQLSGLHVHRLDGITCEGFIHIAQSVPRWPLTTNGCEILGISVCGGSTIIRSNGIENVCHQNNPSNDVKHITHM